MQKRQRRSLARGGNKANGRKHLLEFGDRCFLLHTLRNVLETSLGLLFLSRKRPDDPLIARRPRTQKAKFFSSGPGDHEPAGAFHEGGREKDQRGEPAWVS